MVLNLQTLTKPTNLKMHSHPLTMLSAMTGKVICIQVFVIVSMELDSVNNPLARCTPLISAHNKSLRGPSLGLIVVFQLHWEKIITHFQCLLILTRGVEKCCQVWVDPRLQQAEGHPSVMENGMLGTSMLRCHLGSVWFTISAGSTPPHYESLSPRKGPICEPPVWNPHW